MLISHIYASHLPLFRTQTDSISTHSLSHVYQIDAKIWAASGTDGNTKSELNLYFSKAYEHKFQFGKKRDTPGQQLWEQKVESSNRTAAEISDFDRTQLTWVLCRQAVALTRTTLPRQLKTFFRFWALFAKSDVCQIDSTILGQKVNTRNQRSIEQFFIQFSS